MKMGFSEKCAIAYVVIAGIVAVGSLGLALYYLVQIFKGQY